MTTKTQGTNLYAKIPGIGEASATLMDVGCITGITGVGASRAALELSACLSDVTGSGGKAPGAMTPGASTMNIEFSEGDAAHKKLYDLFLSGDVLDFAIGLTNCPRDIDGDPTSDAKPVVTGTADGSWTLPAVRGFLSFKAFISAFPFDFNVNSVINIPIGLEITVVPVFTPKAA